MSTQSEFDSNSEDEYDSYSGSDSEPDIAIEDIVLGDIIIYRTHIDCNNTIKFISNLDLSCGSNITFLPGGFCYESLISEFTPPTSLIEIGPHCFTNTARLSIMNLSSCTKLRTIQSHFCNISNITKLMLPCSVETIDKYFCRRCMFLDSVDISNCTKLTVIESYFINENNIKNIILPHTVRIIKDGFLTFCFNINILDLSNCIYLNEILDEFCVDSFIGSIILPNSITKIGKYFVSGSVIKTLDMSLCTQLKILSASFCLGTRIQLLKLPVSITEIRGRVLSEAHIDELDMSNLINITDIHKSFCNKSHFINLKLPPREAGFTIKCNKINILDITLCNTNFKIKAKIEILKMSDINMLKDVLKTSSICLVDLTAANFENEIDLSFLGNACKYVIMPEGYYSLTQFKTKIKFIFDSVIYKIRHFELPNRYTIRVLEHAFIEPTLETV
jgi:hypothetical protein